MLGRRSRVRIYTMRRLHVIHYIAKVLSRRERFPPGPLSPANWSAICNNFYIYLNLRKIHNVLSLSTLWSYGAKAERRNVLSWLSCIHVGDVYEFAWTAECFVRIE